MTEALDFDLTLFPHPVLRKVAQPVEAFDAELERTVEAMFALMFESQGVGLAGPQVGIPRRILVMNFEGDPGKPDLNRVLINSKIVDRGGERTLYEEGCLSFPSIYGEVERPDRCKIEAVDIRGDAVQEEFTGFESRVIQHEQDHLEGVLLVDRMSPADKLKNRAALEELVESYKQSR